MAGKSIVIDSRPTVLRFASGGYGAVAELAIVLDVSGEGVQKSAVKYWSYNEHGELQDRQVVTIMSDRLAELVVAGRVTIEVS